MNYLSICSGIEAASCAWRWLGWEPLGFSEIEKFPCSVLAHHYPNVPNLGDLTKITEDDLKRISNGRSIDLIVGGTPCQDVSVAGKRAGIHGERSGLAFEYIRLLNSARPRWIVWENVPGVLSSNQGADFREFINSLNDAGYGVAWRVLDAQSFGVAQRRRRVFLVGYLGDWRPAAAVLFESEGMQGDFAQSAGKTEGASGSVEGCSDSSGSIKRSNCLTPGLEQSRRVLTIDGKSDTISGGHKVFAPGGAIFEPAKKERLIYDPSHRSDVIRTYEDGKTATLTARMGTGGHNIQLVEEKNPINRVRKLTPIECLRLQGFPDDWFAGVEGYSDTAAYKAIGNSMAVPCMYWIGRRLDMVDSLLMLRWR